MPANIIIACQYFASAPCFIFHLTHGFFSKYRTNVGISELLSPLESAVHTCLLLKLIPHAVIDVEHELFSYPVCLGGLGICNPMSASKE